MKSLLVVHAVDRPGGAELALLRAAPLIRQAGWQVTMSGPRGIRPDGLDSDVEWVSQEVGGMGRGQGLKALLGYRQFRAFASEFDVVYLNGGVPARLLPAIASLDSPRTVLHIHDMVRRVPRFWSAANALLADSTPCAAPVKQVLGRKVTVTGCPVDLNPPEANPPWTPDGRPIVAFVGRIEQRKGVLDLLAAVPKVRAEVPEARFLLIGEDTYGKEAEYSRLVAQSADRAAVERWPWQKNIPGLLRHIDLLVVPSHREPFGTVAAEALAVGVPVVASAVDGLVEVVQDGVTGRLVPPKDPAALAHGIVWALRERHLMSGACQESAARWALPNFAKAVLEVLEPKDQADDDLSGSESSRHTSENQSSSVRMTASGGSEDDASRANREQE